MCYVEDFEEKKQMIEDYFKTIGDTRFLEVLNKFKVVVGFALSCKCCEFASEYRLEEEGYFGESGVNFSMIPPLVEEEVYAIIDYKTFFDYLKLICEDYLKRFPNNSDEVNQCLVKIGERFNIS